MPLPRIAAARRRCRVYESIYLADQLNHAMPGGCLPMEHCSSPRSEASPLEAGPSGGQSAARTLPTRHYSIWGLNHQHMDIGLRSAVLRHRGGARRNNAAWRDEKLHTCCTALVGCASKSGPSGLHDENVHLER